MRASRSFIAGAIFGAIFFPLMAQASLLSFVSGMFGSIPQVQADAPTVVSQDNSALEATIAPDQDMAKSLQNDLTISDNSALLAQTGPMGTQSDLEDSPSSPTDQISVYVVHEGDTIEQIAKMYGVSVNTIRYANDIKKGQALTVGRTLIILPVTGIQYTVKKGDTLSSIAKKFSLDDSSDIENYNDISDSDVLVVGDNLIIPGVELSDTVPSKPKTSGNGHLPSSPGNASGSASGYFIKPIPCPLSQGKHDHYAVDLSCHEKGTPIKAAASGTVLFAQYGWNGAFGNLIILSHPNGTQTFYAHILASSFRVSQGDHVSQGQVIAEVGSTGRSTGPHLHFEVRGAKNPGFDPSGNSWKKN